MKQVLFVIHGIGEHADAALGQADPSAWAEEVKQSLLKATLDYPAICTDALAIVPVLYDDVFSTYQYNWSRLAEALAGSALVTATRWFADAAKPGFVWGSLADVALYKGLPAVRTSVITHVAAQLARGIADHGASARYSILAHSLGTAVAHDAVQKLATTPVDGNTALSPPAFRFDNFFAVANVSRLVEADDPSFYDRTRGRPDGCGRPGAECAVSHYVNFRHVADPVPSVVRFARPAWSRDHFVDVELRHFRDPNVHAFTHYLASPRVTDRVLYRLFGPAAMARETRRRRVDAFRDYDGAYAEEARSAVDEVATLLDKLSAQAKGDFDLDFVALLKAIPFVLGALKKPAVRG